MNEVTNKKVFIIFAYFFILMQLGPTAAQNVAQAHTKKYFFNYLIKLFYHEWTANFKVCDSQVE